MYVEKSMRQNGPGKKSWIGDEMKSLTSNYVRCSWTFRYCEEEMLHEVKTQWQCVVVIEAGEGCKIIKR